MAKKSPSRSTKTARRPYEYDHHYGLGTGTKKAASGQAAPAAKKASRPAAKPKSRRG